MIELGKMNLLKASRNTEFGFFLVDDEANEVLLPNVYVPAGFSIGDEIEVFIYNDSEDRPVATTLKPYIQLHEFAVLRVKETNRTGAFMDWGLPKDLLVPFSEQSTRMIRNERYLVFLQIDEKTDRLFGSNKEKKFVKFEEIDLHTNQEVELLVYKKTELGMNAIVNGKYKGLIYKSDIHKKIEIGDKLTGYIKQVRMDGKIDLLLEPKGYVRSIDHNSRKLLIAIIQHKGFLPLTDKSDPELVRNKLGMSKKAFKKALGNLYKQKMVSLEADGIRLVKQKPNQSS